MLPFLWYLLKVIICSGILFGYYWLFLRNKIFHQYNRFYLLTATGLSLLLPLLKINFWQQSAETNGAIRVLRAVSVGDEYMNTVVIAAQKSFWTFENLYPLVYMLVSLVLTVILIRTLFIIRTLLKRYPAQQVEEVTFVNTNDDSTPFSFLKYIFWNSSIDMSTVTGRQIFKHEVAHIQEKHTYDKLFVNILLIVFWCNPFIWLYRKELNMIHEFIADKKAVEDGDTAAFAQMILQAAYPKHRFELTNNFFYSPIKRRLRMLTKIDNPRVSYFARVMVLPLAVLVFAAFTFKAQKNMSIYHGEKITVVIDAGHGGDDSGAMAEDGTYEKELTLAIAKKIKELNENKAIEIILTKETDTRINVRKISEFVTEKNADLFISVHIDKTPTPNLKSGINFYVARDEFENAAQSKVFASALIKEFVDNYPIPVGSSPQQRKVGTWTLQANPIPSVLIEAGYLSNKTDLAYLKTAKAKETIARNVLAAIEKYLTTNTISPVKINNIDTIPTVAPSDIAALKSLKTDIDTFDYYRDYSAGAKTYKGQKIKSVFLRDTDNKFVVVFTNGSKIIMEQQAVYDAKIVSRPPPPPPPPARFDPKIKSTDTNPDVELLTSYKSILYIGIQNHVYVAAKNIKREDISLKISPTGSISGNNGDYKVIVSSVGKTTISVLNNKNGVLIKEFDFEVKRVPDPYEPDFPADLKVKEVVEPRAFLGRFGGGRISIDDLKATKEIRVTQGFNFVSADVWFSHPESKSVTRVQMQSSSTSSIKDAIEKCVNGSTIMFDNVYVQDNMGSKKLVMNPPGFSVFDSKEMKAIESDISDAIIKARQDATDDRNADGNIIFSKTETPPHFIGGQQAWRDFLRKNLNASIPVDSGASAGKFTVIVKFIIHTDGSVSDISCEKDPGYGTCEEVKRIIKESAKKWEPAVQNGKKVNAYHKQPVTFLVED